jgi:hypothetical protein
LSEYISHKYNWFRNEPAESDLTAQVDSCLQTGDLDFQEPEVQVERLPIENNDDDDLVRIQASIRQGSVQPTPSQGLTQPPLFNSRVSAWNSESQSSGGGSSIVRAFQHRKQPPALEPDRRCGSLLVDCQLLQQPKKPPALLLKTRPASLSSAMDNTELSYSKDLPVGSNVLLMFRGQYMSVTVSRETSTGYFFRGLALLSEVFVEDANIETNVRLLRDGQAFQPPV